MATLIGKISTGTYVPPYEETDPTVPDHVKAITQEQIEKWDNGTGGGTGSVVEEQDPTVPEHVKNITTEDIEKWNNNTEGGSSFSGSWNDLTDRPAMYDDYEKTLLVDNLEFTTESNGERGYLFGIPNWTRGVLNGLEYERNLYVVYDGKTYNAPYFQNPDYGNAFGNAFLYWEVIVGDGTGQNNTGEPFAIDTDGYFACYDTEPTQHTLSIYLKGEEIAPVKVPEKYIPTASTTTLGGVKIGDNLSIDENGVLSATSSSSSSGTSDYNDLTNKPSINGVELSGNKTLTELGIQPKGDYATKDDIDNAISGALGGSY